MAAAFERARSALDRAPPLSSTMKRVLQRCGSGADLLLETAAQVCCSQLNPHFQLVQTGLEQYVSMEMALLSRPLLTALQEGCARCERCSPLGKLVIQSVMPSGSSVDCLMPLVCTVDGIESDSDIDYMLQLGPVHWEETDAVRGGSQEAATETGKAFTTTEANSGQQHHQTVSRLGIFPTDNPGFVLLFQAKTAQCIHQEEHLFSADTVRQVMRRFYKANNAADGDMTDSGPATSFRRGFFGLDTNDTDMVPCLRANWWPSEEFFQRSRSNDWPPAAVRDDIRQFGIHLVPVGAKGSNTELVEFRLSFSRAEVVTAWNLLPQHVKSLVLLKICKGALGPEGKPLKSYYMKTALFWLCQNTDVRQWTSIKQCMQMIIDYMERAIEARYLGCFFWSEINLFRQSSPADLEAIRRTLSLLRRNMTRLLAHRLSSYIELWLAPIILHEPCQQLSERQLRVCLARYLVVQGVKLDLYHITQPMHKNAVHMIQMLLRSSAELQLACVLHTLQEQQNLMLLALTVAPDDVMARCRLTSRGGDMFSWDAAPLMGLLTEEDLWNILGDPSAVNAWLKDQRRLPAGLSSPRALADLLLNPSLLAEALRESVPWRWQSMLFSGYLAVQSPASAIPPTSYEDAKRQTLKKVDRRQILAVFESLPRRYSDNQSVLCQYINFWEKERQFLDDPQTRVEYYRIRHSLPDPWRLRQFVFTDSP